MLNIRSGKNINKTSKNTTNKLYNIELDIIEISIELCLIIIKGTYKTIQILLI